MKINVATMMRDSMVWHKYLINQVPRFFNQLDKQILIYNPHLGEAERFIGDVFVAHNDSKDNTLEILTQEKNSGSRTYNVHILEYTGKVGEIRSTGESSRIDDLSRVADTVLEKAREDCDYVMFVESDLIIYDEFLLTKLVDILESDDKIGAVSPLPFVDTKRDIFYDCFVFRDLDGTKWTNQPPWSKEFNSHPELLELSSMGSCVLMRADLIRDNDLRFDGGAFINLCRQIRKLEYKCVTSKKCFIYHPSSNGIIKGRLS